MPRLGGSLLLRLSDEFIQARAHKALRLLRASEKPLKGEVEGWAAGVIYFAATEGRITCGVPGLFNHEFEAFTGVSMGTARYRAARIRDLIVF